MKKVLVTGGCGFIGSHLVDLLISKSNIFVHVLDNMDTGKIENIRNHNCVKYHFGDLRNILDNQELLNELREVEVIYHLGALARIQPSFNRPSETVDVNARGTAVVCELAHKINARVVYAGSSSYYGGVYLNPYSFTKWQGEEVCKMYSKVYNLSTVIARFFNVYGLRHPKEGPYGTVVGIFESQYSSDKPLTITGTGEQRRDFTHVSDIVSGLYAMSLKDHTGTVYNLGTGKNYSVNELAAMFSSNTVYIPARPGEAWVTLADISKTQEELNWVPTETLENYIKNWIAKND
jgi:nucleoside-diphosphate-sugar epimerase